MKTMRILFVSFVVFCLAASAIAKSQSDGGLNVTVAKLAKSLMQTSQDQFKDGKDADGAETCLKIYDLDTNTYKEWLIKAGEGFYRAKLLDKAKATLTLSIEKNPGKVALKVIPTLMAVEYARQNFTGVADLAKKIPEVVEAQESLTSLVFESFYAAGQFDEALSLFAKIQPTKNKRAIEIAALSSEKMGDSKTAITLYEKLMTMYYGSKLAEFSFRIASLYEVQNLRDKAIRVFKSNIAQFPTDLRNYDALSHIYMIDHKWRLAQDVLEKGIAQPKAPAVYVKMLAQSFAEQGNRFAAINKYRDYLKNDPTDSIAWSQLGKVHFQQEHFSEAVDVFKTAVSLMPKNVECLTMLATCYVKTGDARSAIEYLESARLISKKDVHIISQLATCYRMVRDDKKLASIIKEWTIADPKNCQAKYDLAQIYMADSKWTDAIALLENASSMDSTNAHIHLALAKAYTKNGNENARFNRLKKALLFAKDDADVNYELGSYYASKNQSGAARPFLVKAIAADPMHAGAHYEYGKMCRAKGQMDTAYNHLTIAAKLEPFNTAYLVQYAQSAYAVGKKADAFECIKKTLARDSSELEVLQWAGILYKEAGSFDTAKTLLLKSIMKSKTCVTCYKILADIYMDNGEYDLAIKFYNQSLTMGSYSEAASMGLANAQFLSGEFEPARSMFDKVFFQNKKNEEALYRLNATYIRLKKIDKAANLFSQFAQDRKGGWIHLAKAELAEANGKNEEAFISFTVASTLMPENPLAHAGIGRINLAKKEYDAAVENFGKALARAPHNVEFVVGLGKAYEKLNQLQAAFDLYAEVARKAPKNPEVFGLMARVLSNQNQHANAVITLKRGLDFYPKNAAYCFALANEFRQVSQFEDAIKYYKKSVQGKENEKQFYDSYKIIGDVFMYDLKKPEKAKDFYKKYMNVGGNDEGVVALVNTSKK